jgi:hypothetical protein
MVWTARLYRAQTGHRVHNGRGVCCVAADLNDPAQSAGENEPWDEELSQNSGMKKARENFVQETH